MLSIYKDLIIEVIDDPLYTPNSSDNTKKYAIEYLNNGDYEYNSQHGILVSKDGTEISSAIICENGGDISTHKKSYIINNNTILICCGSKIYSLNLPFLTLNWNIKVDMVTCFSIHEFKGDFIVHGEVEVSRITKAGIILWSFSAMDIFVNIEGKKEFEIIDDKIHLVDFRNYNYVLDGDGKLI